MKRDLALSIAGISKHQYYYRPTNRKKGRKSTETTLKKDGDNIERCPNNIVIGDIKVDIPVILTPHSGDTDPLGKTVQSVPLISAKMCHEPRPDFEKIATVMPLSVSVRTVPIISVRIVPFWRAA